MSGDKQALLEAFEYLPAEENRAFTEELRRRFDRPVPVPRPLAQHRPT